MTQEQEARAYDKALERTKKVHKYSSDLAEIKRMEDIFPELRESKDEKIRKALIKFHKSSIDIDGIKGNDIIAWLEKQDKESTEKEFTFKALPRLLEMIEVSDRAKAYTEKLAVALDNEGYHTDAKIVRESIKMMNGEDVPMATMDEDEKIRNAIIGCLKGNMPDNDYRKEYIAWLERQAEQKPTKWSEEDVQTLDRIISNYQYFCMELSLKEKLTDVERTVIGNVNKEDIDWLKSLKNRVVPQPKQEWDGTEIAPPIDSDVCG